MWTVNVWVEVMVFLHQCPGTTGAIKVHIYLPVLHCITVCILRPLFWFMNVIENLLVICIHNFWCISYFFLKNNLMLLTQRTSDFFKWGFLEYSRSLDRNQEGFPLSSFPLPILIFFDWNKDIWMDSNQVYNLIIIGWNNPNIMRAVKSCQIHTRNFWYSKKHHFSC